MEDKNIFFDTNIFLDILEQREPFVSQAELIFRSYSTVFVSAITITNAYYIAKVKDKVKFQMFAELYEIIDLTREYIDFAFKLALNDFEDAIQLVSASQFCDYLVTRNKEDFKNNPFDIQIVTPEELINIEKL